MSPLGIAVLVAYFATLLILRFTLHRYHLLRLYRGPPGEPEACRRLDPCRLTVQLPIYNELYVIERLIRRLRARLSRDRLEIQVIDDSDDETRLCGGALSAMRRAGHTSCTCGAEAGTASAGALAYALARARVS